MTLLTEQAKWLARFIHAGEVRRNGEPYHVHCDEVEEGVKGKGEIVESAAQLHDVKENSKNPEIVMEIIDEFFPHEVYILVDILTHDKKESYITYINKILKNPDALIIKFSDMISNTKNPSEKQKAKYRSACIHMISKGVEIPKILKERLNIEDKDVTNTRNTIS